MDKIHVAAMSHLRNLRPPRMVENVEITTSNFQSFLAMAKQTTKPLGRKVSLATSALGSSDKNK